MISFQNYAIPACVSWDRNASNWTENGCMVAVNKNGGIERDNSIINCSCDHFGIFGVKVVSREPEFICD